MHNSIKIAAVMTVVAAVICACGGSYPKIKSEEKSYKTDNCEAVIKVPEIETEKVSDFVSKLNKTYNKEVSAIIDDFLSKNNSEESTVSVNADTEVTRNDGRIVSIIFEGEAFDGGAHGEKFRICKTVDLEKEKIISVEELFESEEWKQMINNKMKILAETDDDYSELWEIPSVELLKSENFYLKNNSIVMYFPPYELSYYRRGYVEFEFKAEEISGYLSDYGREIIK